MENGFSGRSLDTKYITPTMKELKLPSMSESGWLTRSLEQPYPYTKEYNGKVGSPKVKKSFLDLVDYIENNPQKVEDVLRILLHNGILVREKNTITVRPIESPERITIDKVISSLNEFFSQNYHISGGSKLPVISFYTIYKILLKEIKRYKGCVLGEQGSHTSSDRTSKTSGDIEIFLDKELLESLEIKFGIEIDKHIVNRVIEKIHKYNPKRYYVLTTLGIKQDDYDEIMEKVHELKSEHGCQLILNGLLPTLKYYLRLIDNTEEFLNLFTTSVFEDKELKHIHKKTWEDLLTKHFR
jgi:DNA (cytosine-5)-methyltransferase 1